MNNQNPSQNDHTPPVKRGKYSLDIATSGSIQNVSNANLAEYPIHSDPVYPSRMQMQGQRQGSGAYPMNTSPRGADHTGYHMNYGTMSQGEQTGYWATHYQSAMPGPSRIGAFSSCATSNAVMDANNNPRLIGNMKVHQGAGHYDPTGMMKKSQIHHQQHSILGISPNPGGMRLGFQNMGIHFGQINTSKDPFQTLISDKNMGQNSPKELSGDSLMGQNITGAAQVAGQEHSSLSPNQPQFRTTAYPPSSIPLQDHASSQFQGKPPPPPIHKPLSYSCSLPHVIKSSIYQVVSSNQTTPYQSLLLNAIAAQGTSHSQLQPGGSKCKTGPANSTTRQLATVADLQRIQLTEQQGISQQQQVMQLRKEQLQQQAQKVLQAYQAHKLMMLRQQQRKTYPQQIKQQVGSDVILDRYLLDQRQGEQRAKKFKELYYKAKHNLGTEELQLYKLVIFGPPGVGKSSLFKVLLDKHPDTVRNSTGAFNRKLIQVKVAISTLPNQSKSSWNLISIEDEISRLRSIIERVVEDPKLGEVRLPEDFVDKSQMKVEEKLLQSSANVSTEIKCVSTLMSCYDSGGQPEFFDVMPALTTTPTGNIMVFNLSKNLDSKIDSEFYEEGQSSRLQYQAHYTTAELMKTAIANIQSYSNKKISSDAGIAPSSDEINAGCLLVVGTHLDLCGQTVHEKQQKVDKIEKVMCNDILAGKAMRMVHCDCDHRIIHSISNVDSDGRDEAAQTIRTAIEDMSKHAKSYSQIPINWLLFQLEVQLTDKDYIGRNRCMEIAKGCYIKEEEVDYVLMYFHELGILLHYREVSGLKDIIFCNPQWLFDQLTEVIKLKYKATPMIQKSINRGILYSQRLCEIYSKKLDTEGELKTENLIELFIHLKIMSLLPNKSDQYFMPALLNPAPTDISLQEEFGKKVHDTMLVKFEDRYFPRGMFCCLVTHLSQNNWEIQFKCVYKNLIVFQYLPNQYVALFDKITYIAVEIHCKNESNIRTNHYEVCITLYDSLKELCKMFQMSHDFEMGFVCKDCLGFAAVKPLNQYSVSTIYFCRECEISFKQTFSQLAWFLPSDVYKPKVLYITS